MRRCSGKTYQVIRWLRNEMKRARSSEEEICFVYAVHRRSLGQDLLRRFKNGDEKVLEAREQVKEFGDDASPADKELAAMPLLNFRYDLEKEFDNDFHAIQGVECLIIQVDSIPAKLRPKQTAKFISHLILDEIGSLLRQMASSFNPPDIWEALLYVTANAGKVVMMDGLADRHTQRFTACVERASIKGKVPKPVFWRENQDVAFSGLKYHFTRDEPAVMGYVAAMLMAGKKVAMGST